MIFLVTEKAPIMVPSKSKSSQHSAIIVETQLVIFFRLKSFVENFFASSESKPFLVLTLERNRRKLLRLNPACFKNLSD